MRSLGPVISSSYFYFFFFIQKQLNEQFSIILNSRSGDVFRIIYFAMGNFEILTLFIWQSFNDPTPNKAREIWIWIRSVVTLRQLHFVLFGFHSLAFHSVTYIIYSICGNSHVSESPLNSHTHHTCKCVLCWMNWGKWFKEWHRPSWSFIPRIFLIFSMDDMVCYLHTNVVLCSIITVCKYSLHGRIVSIFNQTMKFLVLFRSNRFLSNIHNNGCWFV